MFDELPETNPSRDSRKPRAIAAATLIQAALVALLILLQMAVPQRFGKFQMISGTSAAPPTVEATVTERGDVADIKVISGPPILIPAAVKAVEEWKYEPTLINGRPVPVILTARVSFSLRQSR